MIVDKGQQHGVKAGQPGDRRHRRRRPGHRASIRWLAEVTLITDKDQAVPVQNLRNGLRAVAFGGTGNDGSSS